MAPLASSTRIPAEKLSTRAPCLCCVLLLCVQAEECLRLEEERVDNYLHTSTKPKLLKQVRQLHSPERISLMFAVCQRGVLEF
jgi:hypothetical protein